MQRELITSPIFDSIGYDESEQILEILYNDGRHVQYLEVPYDIQEELFMKTVGAYETYFSNYIEGHYELVVLEEADES